MKLTSFNGEDFDFPAIIDKDYILLQDHNLQVNAHFNGHALDKIAVIADDNVIICNAADGKITVNDIKLYQYTYLNINDYYGFAEIRFNFYASNFTIPALAATRLIETLFIDVGRYYLYILRSISRSINPPCFYNFVATARTKTNPKGAMMKEIIETSLLTRNIIPNTKCENE